MYIFWAKTETQTPYELLTLVELNSKETIFWRFSLLELYDFLQIKSDRKEKCLKLQTFLKRHLIHVEHFKDTF